MQEWRRAHPSYAERKTGGRPRRRVALQVLLNPQPAPPQSPALPDAAVALQEASVALQDDWKLQPPMVVGLIAHLTPRCTLASGARVSNHPRPRRKPILRVRLQPIRPGAHRPTAHIVEFDHPSQLHEFQPPIAIRIRRVSIRQRDHAPDGAE